jgi:hypothetical protein
MKPARHNLLSLLTCLLLLAIPSLAEKRHDPLNQLEIDQLREAALEPDKRLKFFITYARERLASLEQARSDPKTTDRGEATHEWLTDFLDIYDELNDNVDMYDDRKDDLRKTLPIVIEADTEFQSKLRALQAAANTGKNESKQYEFVLTTALETIDHSIEDHRDTLKAQEEFFKKKKDKDKKK